MSDKSKKGVLKSNDKKNNYIKLIICGFAGSGVFFLLIAILSFLTLKFSLPDFLAAPLGFVFAALSGFFSGYAAVKPIMQKGLVFGAISGLICLFVCSSILFVINKTNAGIGLIILSLIILAASAVGGIAAVSTKPKRKR